MTLAVIRREADRWAADITGHAGYAAKDDIVCAGVSTLAYTLLGMIRKLEADGAVTSVFTDCGTSGEVRAAFSAKPGYESGAELLMRTIVMGLEMIAQKYPEHVRVEKSY